MVMRLAVEEARRIAVQAQLLTSARPADIVETVYGLTAVNIDPTAAIAPSADLILWSRIGWPFSSADLVRAVEHDRDLFEWGGFYRLMSDLPLVRGDMTARPRDERSRRWLRDNDAFRRDVIARVRESGPLHASDVPDTADVSWASRGWTNNRNSSQMIEILVARGELAVSGRDSRGRLFDLAERVYPDDLPAISDEDAARERVERRLSALGIARRKAVAQPYEPIDADGVGEPAIVDGVDGEWRVDAAALDNLAGFTGRVALLSPFDRLVFDRDRLLDLFGFEYVLEMYKPAAQRRWGYFALPILFGDRFIGKLDAKVDRRAGVLQVHGVHEDEPFAPATRDAVAAEIDALARWLGVEVRGWD